VGPSKAGVKTSPRNSRAGRIRREARMTYMGKPYYPEWLDNLADDVTMEAAAMDGTAHGPDDVRSIVLTAKEL
jgi:hypothetical protein